MAKKTQCEMVLDYMQKYGSITTFEAFIDLGCTRLSSRINDLRNACYRIVGEFESRPNRFGEKVSYKRYTLAKESGDSVAEKM